MHRGPITKAALDPTPVSSRSDWWRLGGLIAAISLYWTVSANGALFRAAVADRDPSALSTWAFAAAVAVGVFALNTALVSVVALVAGRRALKPVLGVLVVCTALAAHYMQQYGVYLDASMLRNVLHTRPGEAKELIGVSLLGDVALYGVLPLLALWWWPLGPTRWRTRLATGTAGVVLGLVLVVAAVLSVFQPMASWMRNHKEVRYLITPANIVWSVGRVVASDTRSAVVARQPIGLDAAPGARMQARQKPTLLVLVVGETARAANWGLNGYPRQTTPQLAAMPAVINFKRVTSCGTNTEVSLPCMFAPVGRRDYDEATIRGQESLLHVLARAGVAVQWRDNQTGCKGVCEGLPTETVRQLKLPGLCDTATSGDHCLDEGLLHGLDERLATAKGTQVLVLHQLGNHGPSYFRRYPAAFATFQPACTQDDLARCSLPEIVNAYDNALLYTDHLLATVIKTLQARAGEVDSAVIYVSDHGESLGEKGLFLHGIPYAIAPAVQTEVPMVAWLSEGFATHNAVDTGCLKQRATQPAAHDHLFHTVLGLLDVKTALYAPAFDLTAGCRTGR